MRSVSSGAGARRGATIVELVVAMSILAVGLLGVISAISGALAANENAREAETALAALQDGLARLRDLGYERTNTSSALLAEAGEWTVPEDYQEVLGEARGTIEFLSEAVAASRLDSPALDLDKDGSSGETEAARSEFMFLVVEISLTWTSRQGERTLKLTGIIFPEEVPA